MNTDFDVVVLGGGLAGCAAGIELAGRRVLVVERHRYPVHKLCGEFLSMEGVERLAALGLGAAMQAAVPITRTRITAPGGAVFSAPLPGTARGLSRYTLDALLADRAREAGAEVWAGVTVLGVAGGLDGGFRVETSRGVVRARVVLGAFGKRSRLDGRMGRPHLARRSPFVAFKAHFEGIELPGVVELHAFPGGYCGLAPVEGGGINACWIVRKEALTAAGGTPEAMIARTFADNPALAERFAGLRRCTDRFLAAGQLAFHRRGLFDGDVCMVGDAAGMIAPLAGDGMAMALHGAALAAPLAADFLAGRRSAGGLRRAYERAWRRAFGARMGLARWIHRGLVHPVAAPGLRLVGHWPALGHWLIRRTRGLEAVPS